MLSVEFESLTSGMKALVYSPAPNMEELNGRPGLERSKEAKLNGHPGLAQIGSNLVQSRCPAVKSLKLNSRTSTRRRIVLVPRSTRQPGIKLLSKCIAVGKRKRRRTAPDIAAGSHCVHKISHAEYSTNCIGGITLAPRIDCIAALGDDFGRQGNICRHHQVPRRHTLNNFVVGDVEARAHLDRPPTS